MSRAVEGLMIGTAIRSIALITVGSAIVACAQPGAASGDVAPVTHDRSVLSLDDLHAANAQFLYDVVQQLRPEWLRAHGSTSIATGLNGNTDSDQVHVYVGDLRVGGPEVLTRIQTDHATSLKFYTAAEAQQHFGPGNVNGAIQVISTPPPPP